MTDEKWTDKIKAWHIVIGIVLMVVGASFGVGKFLYAFDQKKADRIELTMMSKQMQVGFTEINRDSTQKAIYSMEDRFQCGPRWPKNPNCYTVMTNPDTKKAYCDLINQLKKQNNKIQELKGK